MSCNSWHKKWRRNGFHSQCESINLFIKIANLYGSLGLLPVPLCKMSFLIILLHVNTLTPLGYGSRGNFVIGAIVAAHMNGNKNRLKSILLADVCIFLIFLLNTVYFVP